MSKHRVEDADFFVTNLLPTEVKFVIAELSVLRQQQRFSLSQPHRFSRIIGVLAGRRFFNILFPLDALRRYFQTLATGKEADADVAERAINILSQSMTPSARRIQIVGCPITPPPPEKEKIVFGSKYDRAIVAGCDDQIGHLYNAKSNATTVWIGAKFFSDANRLMPHNSELDGRALCESFLSLVLLHEFVHILLNQSPYEGLTKQLRELYQNAAKLIPPELKGKIVVGPNDEIEFVVQAIAYENCRVDRFERRQRFLGSRNEN